MEAVAQLTAISSIQSAGPSGQTADGFIGLEPAAVGHRLAILRDTLNARDPHFSYAFAVSDQPEAPTPRRAGYPALVASNARMVGESWVSFHVFARCAESLQERPITMEGTIVVKRGSAEAREFDEFQTYGRAPRRAVDVTDLDIDLPGGLGAS